MDDSLKDMIRKFPVSSPDAFKSHLEGLGKPYLVKSIAELMTMYYNDLNSSTLRELLVVLEAGFEPNPGKLGYDGERTDPETGRKTFCEVKPVNIRPDSANPKKLSGSGNLGDYSWAKFARHKKENPVMLVAGFVAGKIIYIFQFPFNTAGFTARLEAQLQGKFPDGDRTGIYLRSANFGFQHYAQSAVLETRCYVTRVDLDGRFKGRITRPVREHLRRFAHG